MNNKFKSLGVVGLGHIGLVHLQAINDIENLEVTALCDSNVEVLYSLKRYLKTGNQSCFCNIQSMIQFCNYDWLVVATPNSSHFSIAKSALENDMPVILEKPACQTYNQFIELLTKSLKKYSYLFCISRGVWTRS